MNDIEMLAKLEEDLLWAHRICNYAAQLHSKEKQNVTILKDLIKEKKERLLTQVEQITQ